MTPMTAAARRLAPFLICLVGLGARANTPWPELGPSATRPGGGERDAALIVAIEDYATLPDIAGAAANGKAWRAWFLESRGLRPDRVQLLMDAEGTPAQVLAQVKRLTAAVGSGGRFWFVFIGHGAPAAQGGDGVLVGPFAQQNPIDFYAQSLPTRSLEAQIADSGRTAILVLDACFSGRTPGGGALVPGLQPVLLTTRERSSKSVHILSAGASDEFAGPLPGADRPAFSYLVLGALRGWGDARPYGDGNRQITLGEVLELSRGALAATLKGRNQTPELLGDADLVLTRSADEPAPDFAHIQSATLERREPPARPPVRDEAVPAARPTRTLAILGLDPKGLTADKAWLGASFADAVTTYVAGLDADVRVVERAALDLVLKELKLQQSAAFEPSGSARVGRLIGADTVLVGSIALLGDKLVARGRLIVVETGEVKKGFEASGFASELLALQHTFTQRLLAALGVGSAGTGVELGAEVSLDLQGRLVQLRALAGSTPAFGLDPARRRKRAELELARTQARAILAESPNLPEALGILGRVALQLDDVDTAAAAATALRASAVGSVPGLLLEASIHAAERDRGGAVDAALEATRRAPSSSLAWHVLAQASVADADFPLAVQAWLRAMETAPEVRPAIPGLAAILRGSDAARIIETLGRVDRNSGLAAEAYLDTLHGTSQVSWDRLEALVSARPRLWIGWFARARALASRGDPRGALADLRRAVALAPSSPDLHRELALAMAGAGQCDEARDHASLYRALESALSDGARVDAAVRHCR